MSPTLKTILLGAALATATPIAQDTTHHHQNTVSLATILPEGMAPVHMAQVADPATEMEKCSLDLYLSCASTHHTNCGQLLDSSRGCKLGPLVESVVGSLPASVDLSSPITVVDDNDVVIARDNREASAPALERRQKELCPKKCAAWAALPPFGAWFAAGRARDNRAES